MTASTILEIIGLLAGGSGGSVAIVRLTRLVVAVEGLVEDLRALSATVQGHETRIATIEGQQKVTTTP